MKRIWLIENRLNNDLTQKEVATLANIERSTYTKAELGYPINIKTAKKISDILNLNWIYFFEDDNN